MGDVRFDATVAERLINDMYGCCINIRNESEDLKDIVCNSDDWNDNQRKAFENNIYELVDDLRNAISIELEYMETFRQRVFELRG